MIYQKCEKAAILMFTLADGTPKSRKLDSSSLRRGRDLDRHSLAYETV